ncbi:SIP domain-containing protein [Streptomyces sp. 7-21]|uniref:SIP domain-containing protein n=1 Tax=Streptomyces sp. 7-21 TaxID=2802283 RepID=UPI0027DE1408|nr:SIP domain-containing protein [Streptomyces sp. 7-21]
MHGDAGLAGPWARKARLGDTLRLRGPAAPTPDPAATGTCWRATRVPCPPSPPPWSGCGTQAFQGPAQPVVRAVIEVAGADEEQKPGAPEGAETVWLRRGGARVGGRLAEAVRAMDFPDASMPSSTARRASSSGCAATCVWTGACRARTCRSPATGAWGTTRTAGRPPKREWNAQVEAEQESGA